MWSFFSRDAAKDFGYEIGPEVNQNLDPPIWKLHTGKKKSNGDAVSVFTFEASSQEVQPLLVIAKASAKRLKTLRHPCIVTYVDSLETDKLVYLVTEKVEPLSNHLADNAYSESQKQLAISWGLYQIASGLGFLNKDCNLSHNNVRMGSVFVDRAGEWKLFGLEYVAQCQEQPPSKSLCPHLKKYDPPELDASSSIKVHNWSYDSWGLGCLIWEAFNGILKKKSSLNSTNEIPQNLTPSYNELMHENPTSRPSTITFLKKATRPRGFFKNRFVETMLFLREIHIKETDEKIAFFNNLSSVLDSFPQDICLYKVLPELINAFEFGNAGSSVLSPMFKLGKHLSDEEYQQRIVPCVVKMFTSKDRSTRVKLLQQMEEFIHHFSPTIINSQIFPSVAQGFLDTSPVIREYTIKCIFFLAPKLNYQNLNEEVLKHLAKLQTKDEGGIRTNTTICLGKIACYLHPQTRKKVLISAFLRALRDPFPPARIAAILALSATEKYYSYSEVATRVVPAICHFTVDSEKSVRDQAFKSIDGFLCKLKSLSEDPSLAEEMEKELQSMTPSEVAASWTSWAVTSLVDKLHMPALSRSASASAANAVSSSPPSTNTAVRVESKVPESKSIEKIKVHEDEEKTSANEVSTDSGGWDAEWNEEEEFVDAVGESPLAKTYTTEMVKEDPVNDWATDDWSSFLKVESVHENEKKISSYFSKETSEDPFSALASEPKKFGLNLVKSGDGWEASGDQWGDWDETETATKSPEKQQKHSEEKLAREEKRRQRLKERQSARPKKLGAQKIS